MLKHLSFHATTKTLPSACIPSIQASAVDALLCSGPSPQNIGAGNGESPRGGLRFSMVFLGDLVHICTMVKLHRISWDHEWIMDEWINWDFMFFTATEQGSMFTCGTYSSCQLVLATCGSGFGKIPLAQMELFFREILQLIPSPDVSHHRNHGPMVDVGKETTPSYGRSFRTGSISACFDTSVNDVDGLTKPCTSNLGWLKLASQPSQWGW